MKIYIFTLLMLCAANAFGQNEVEQNLKAIHSIEEAETFIENFPELKPQLVYLSSAHDTSGFDKKLLAKKRDDFFKVGQFTYKIIDDTIKKSFRVSYIYLDGTKLPLAQVDSLRQIIMSKYKSGVPFPDLASQYTMDGNTKQGDTGFFKEGMMMKEFEVAVKQHKMGDIFKVDIPANQWYYIVKKTYDDQVTRETTVLRVNAAN